MHLHHAAIIASDYARSKAFYTQVLGLEVMAEHFRAARDSWKCDLSSGGRYLLELFSFPNPPPHAGSAGNSPEACGARHAAFAVADAVASRPQARGAVCEALRIDEFTGKKFFFVKDPDGLPLEFYETDCLDG